MHPSHRITITLIALLTCLHNPAPAQPSMAEDFKSPPLSVRPRAFWDWLNGNVDRDRIVYDLDQMLEKGMGGAEIWDVAAHNNGHMVPAGPRFLDPESAGTIQFALQHGKKLGLRMGMITSSGWNAGGTWVTPDWASKMLITTSTVISGGAPYSGRLPFPDAPPECPRGPNGLPVWHKEVALLAVPESADKIVTSPVSIINISDYLQPDGTLNWTPPPGSWRVFRFVCTNTGQILIVPSPKSAGLFIDFLDPEATRRHFGEILRRLDITTENASDSGLKYLEVDSMELHKGNPWTDKFSGWFEDNFDYNIIPLLPALEGWTIENKAVTDAVIYDYRKAVSDLLIHSHYETGSAFLKEYGIDLVGEAGGPGPPVWDTCPVDALKALGNVTIPRGEFWIKHRNMFLIKEVASAAHIYGKPVVDAESFTTWRRFEDGPFALKILADRAFAEGLNQITIHTFAHSPESAGLPGRTYHAGIDINPNVTWWPFARPFMDYLSRVSYMLQQGKPVADVLWYYGDQAPNFFPLIHDVPEKPRLAGLGRGYDYDVVNSDVILNRLEIKEGRYTLPDGVSYSVLAFPPESQVSLKVLEKLSALVHDGGTLLAWPPEHIPGLDSHEKNQARLKEISHQLWGDSPTTGSRTVGRGKVYSGLTLDEVLKDRKVPPDFQVVNWSKKQHIDYIHRATVDKDIYFVRNESTSAETINGLFRSKHKHAGIWDPATGEASPLSLSSDKIGRVTANLTLDPGGSTFVVLGDKPSNSTSPVSPSIATTSPLQLTAPWTLTFPPNFGAPKKPLELKTLASWTESDLKGMRYFSGIATYLTTFDLDPASTTGAIKLDLGDVREVAEVLVNDKPAGITWKPPYRVDITSAVKPGSNTLQVRVANLWHNRLVGDAGTTESKRITKTNVRMPDRKAPLIPSGLLGPVSLVQLKQ